MAEISMNLNGQDMQAKTADNVLLVDFLRDTAGLTGTHVGCDTSQCGACLVHVDGDLVKSCTLFVAELDGKQITTIEGIAGKGGELSKVQQAFQTHHGLQCGFCTAGMVMAATALLRDNPKPSRDQIKTYLEGNICRCTGYQNIINAVLAASGQEGEITNV